MTLGMKECLSPGRLSVHIWFFLLCICDFYDTGNPLWNNPVCFLVSALKNGDSKYVYLTVRGRKIKSRTVPFWPGTNSCFTLHCAPGEVPVTETRGVWKAKESFCTGLRLSTYDSYSEAHQVQKIPRDEIPIQLNSTNIMGAASSVSGSPCPYSTL